MRKLNKNMFKKITINALLGFLVGLSIGILFVEMIKARMEVGELKERLKYCQNN